MDKDENREPQQQDDAEGQDDLEVSGDEAEGVAGGLRSNPDRLPYA